VFLIKLSLFEAGSIYVNPLAISHILPETHYNKSQEPVEGSLVYIMPTAGFCSLKVTQTPEQIIKLLDEECS
jgi:hypothetical protein